MLSVKGLSISFGGLKAVNNFAINIEKGQLYGLIGPNGAGKTTIFNLLTGVYKPDTGTILLDGQNLTGKSTTDINKAGIARTFQNIRLFKDLSVLDNVKAGLHNHHTYSTIEGILRLPRYYKVEKEMDEEAMELLKVFGLDNECDFKGTILLDGQNLTGKSTTDINKAGIARTFQNIRLFKDLSVLDNVKAGLHNHHTYSTIEGILRLPRYYKVEKEMDEEAMELLKVFGLDNECDFKASNLPYGKQRKLEIARALATKPKLLLLDEPAAGMNPNETAELMETIRFVRDHFGMTILLIEHDMKLVSGICERLTVLNFGQVLCTGPTQEVLSNPDVIKAYLGDE